MKLLTVISLAFCFFATATAQPFLSFVPNSSDPNNPGHCFHKELQLAIKLDETITPSNVDLCAELTCEEGGLIRLNQCSRVQPICEDFQYHPLDFTKPFPDCCESYTCNK
ncbi:uncharacterized protein LOC126759257 [Bactrocera neohumeralis]|uniref:uncharacterized protein LOC120773360 n=1 Tax=Bactrocera tryoni TaxID=59916 RepID=UPI001A95EBA0|nr:uncharacterized protein LOC120773360 [Bactrocera tryoni]XP_050329940.1 uncharacterized protein LOC126759257 [Bactrocera neohumeralis]